MKKCLRIKRVASLVLWHLLLLLHVTQAWSTELVWTGCGVTKAAFMEEIAAAYQKKTGITIRVTGGGATKGIQSASAGTSDIGGTCRHWLGGEGNKNPLEANAELVQVAWDAIVAITHKDNPVNNITLENLRKVYDGEVTSWQNLGGDDRRIILVERADEGSGVGYMFRLMVFHDPVHVFKARYFKMGSTEPLEKKISTTPFSLAIDGVSSARKMAVRILALDGVAPTKQNIASGRYPLFRPIYLAVNKDATADVKDLIHFVLSVEGQAIIAAQGTVNLAEGQALAPLWRQKSATFYH